MSRYDGLIIPRSYSEYINKTDAATLQQALQLSGVLSGAVAAGDNKAVTSNAVNNALTHYLKVTNISFDYGIIKSIPLESFSQGVYLVHLNFLYSSWDLVYLGIYISYSTDLRDLIPICNNPHSPVEVSLSSDKTKIVSSSIISSAKFIQLGYW